ncbi:hypothetical protein E8F20_22100 [Pseudomonas sp. BN415]|nr:hypothetical protein [Pseudomonas sp. BN415]
MTAISPPPPAPWACTAGPCSASCRSGRCAAEFPARTCLFFVGANSFAKQAVGLPEGPLGDTACPLANEFAPTR